MMILALSTCYSCGSTLSVKCICSNPPLLYFNIQMGAGFDLLSFEMDLFANVLFKSLEIILLCLERL